MSDDLVKDLHTTTLFDADGWESGLGKEAADEITRLRAAINGVMIGGNHLSVRLPDPCPPIETDPLDALEQIGASIEFDVWCAWRSIMLARAALGDDKGEGDE